MRVINEWRGSARYTKGLTGEMPGLRGWPLVPAATSLEPWPLSGLPPGQLLLPPQTAKLLPVKTCIKCKEKSITRVVYCIAYGHLAATSENGKSGTSVVRRKKRVNVLGRLPQT